MSKHLTGISGSPAAEEIPANVSIAYDDSGAVVKKGPRIRSQPTLARPEVKRPPSAVPLPPRVIAAVDDEMLLGVSVLTLAKELRLSSAYVGRILVQYHPGRCYLVLTPVQWTVLKSFESGRTVATTLKHLLHNRGVLPLREFYELILKAAKCGVLQTPGYPLPPEVSSAPWRLALTSRVVRPLAVGALLASIVLLLVNPVQAPTHYGWWLPGWLLLCGAASAGAALVASVIHGADGGVYRPRVIWRSLLPRFTIDHDEVLLGGRSLDVDIALAQLVPYAILAALAALYAPPLALPLFCGLLWNLAPVRGLPGLRLLRALRHSPRLSTARDFVFQPNKTLWHALRQMRDAAELRFLALRVGYAVPWLLLVALTWAATTRFDVEALWQSVWRNDLAVIAAWAGGGLLAAGVITTAIFGTIILAQTWRARRVATRDQEEGQRAALPRPLPTVDEIAAFYGETHPFQHLPAKRRQLVAEGTRVTPFAAGEVVLAAGDTRARFYLLYSGSVRVSACPPRGPDTLLSAGCIVAEGVILNGGSQPSEVRGIAPGILLSFNREVYEEVVVPIIPRHKIEDAVEKITFLRQISLSRHWSVHLLDSFARRAISYTFTYNTVLLEEGRENLWFYVLQEGELNVVRGGRKVGHLRAGDYFGEISLLQNSLTTAEVIGHLPGRYLAIPKQDFLAFLVQYHGLAMQFEEIASRRLGRPVFPL